MTRLAEWFRRGLLVVAPLALTFPFLTSRPIGGADARWYVYMLADALEQMRAGHVPALVGQGSFAWNGAVHPFRSAPVYLWLGELWNAVTFSRLNPYLVQHLTVVTSAVAGTLGFYAAAVALAPLCRWRACLAALIYLAVPAWLGLVVWADAYMSYMAFAALPLVMYANARIVASGGERGYAALAAGLALIWMCHPPIAALASLATVLIQGGFMMSARPWPWARVAGSLALFAALSAYYFIGMSELPPRPGGDGAPIALIQMAGLALAFMAVGACALKGRGLSWALVGSAGLLMLAATSWPWLVWVAATSLLAVAVGNFGLISRRFDPATWAFELLFGCVLGGAALAYWVLGIHRDDASWSALNGMAQNVARARAYLLPETWPQPTEGAIQLGWTVEIGMGLMALGFVSRRPLVAKLFFAAAATGLLCFFRVPAISDFLVGYLPNYFVGLTNFPLGLRLLPVVAGFAVMAGFLWLADASSWHFGVRFGVLATMVVAAAWSGFQASFVVRWTVSQMSDREHTAIDLRPENAVLYRYAYDLLRLPAYFSNGKMDPAIESRLRDSTGRLIFGPKEAARISETRSSKRIRLRASLVDQRPGWLSLEPRLTLGPGENQLIRFEFDPKKNYAGYLIMVSPHGYREYHLPNSGEGGGRPFGVGSEYSQVISLWNSGTEAESYRFTFFKQPGNSFDRDGEPFVDLVISKPDAAAWPVQLNSLIPYRAEVSAPSPATLETIRAFIPGYQATVDGHTVPITRSSEAEVEIPVPAGKHVVELRYAGTPRLRVAAVISLLAWSALGLVYAVGWARRRFRRGRAIAAIALAALLLAEFLIFDRQTSRHETWVYPRWNDQIQYLTEAYTGYQFALTHGLGQGLWHTLLKPSAQGVLYDSFALLAFWVAGASRSAALAINLLAWLGIQSAFYAVTVRRWRSRSLGWMAVALLLCWSTPLAAGPGSAIDFRLDFMAACAFGVALAAVINTNGFRSTGASWLAGGAIGLALLIRFLTGTYFVVIVAGLFIWILTGARRWRRGLNLLLATATAGAMALPEFWRNREWVWNYYVIGHFTGPESSIRNPHFGVGRSLAFIGESVARDHLGLAFGVCGLAVTSGWALAALWRTRWPLVAPASDDQGAAVSSDWWVPTALFIGAPAVVLTLHSQKSPIVLSILVPGIVAALVGCWAWLSGRPQGSRHDRWPSRVGAVLAIVAMLIGAGHFLAAQAEDPHGAEFTRDARKVNALADYIFTSSRLAALPAPRVGVDRITDSLDGQVLRVICYERHHVWVPFVMTLPTGIMREREPLLFERLAESDYVFIASGDGAAGGFPYDQEMRALRPQTEAWCQAHLVLMDRFPLGGRTWELYERTPLRSTAGP